MIIRLKKTLPKLIIPAILAVLSFLIIARLRSGIIALGESSIYINPQYYNYLSSWEEKINFGIFSSHQSNIVLYIVFWNIFNFFSSFAHPSVIFIFLSYFLSGIFFFLLLKNIYPQKSFFIYLPSVLLYTFNPFRMLGPINERLHLLFIFMPLFLFSHLRLLATNKWKYVYSIVLISFLSSSMGGNPPVFSIPYLLMILHLAFHLIFFRERSKIKTVIIQHLCLFLLVFLVNLFWIWPTVVGLLNAFNNPAIRNNIFLALGSGTFLDHFRFIGSWAWRGGHMGILYYPFSPVFDAPLFYLVNMLVPLCVIFSFLLIRRIHEKDQMGPFYLMATLFPVSLVLLAGDKGPTGILINFLYKHIPFFLIYREPFAKFTPLFVLASSVLLILTTHYFSEVKPKLLAVFLITGVTAAILVSAYPLFTGESNPAKSWSGGQTGYLVKIPSYWGEAKKVIEQDLVDDKLTISPFTRYGNTHSWPFGVGTANEVSEYIFNKPIIKGWTFDQNDVNEVINNIFKQEGDSPPWLSRYLGLLNSRQLIQMNDLDWRYSGSYLKPPSEMKKYLSSLSEVGQFGYFTREYLNDVDLDPDTSRRARFVKELEGAPGLILYGVKKEDFIPHLYVPRQVITTSEELSFLPNLISGNNWVTPSAVYFINGHQNKLFYSFSDNETVLPDNSVCATNVCRAINIISNPVLEYKKISATNYQVLIHGAKSSFPLVFSENFDHGWKIYQRKLTNASVNIDKNFSYRQFEGNEAYQATEGEIDIYVLNRWISNLGTGGFVSKNLHGTIQNNNLAGGKIYDNWFSEPAIEENLHYRANGFANSWIINPKELCNNSKGKCVENKDGSLELELIIEFFPQRNLVMSLAISMLVIITSTGTLLFINREYSTPRNQ